MSRCLALLAALPLIFSCVGKRSAAAPELVATPELAVFHTERGVYVLPIAVGSTGWQGAVSEYHPGACIDSDADNDGVPASLDEDEPSSVAGAQRCGRCEEAEPFRAEVRESEIELSGARILSRIGDVATVLSPYGAIRVELAAGTPALPGAHVRVRGVRDTRSPWDTVSGAKVTVLCAAPAAVAFAALPPGAQLLRATSLDSERAPLQPVERAPELAQR